MAWFTYISKRQSNSAIPRGFNFHETSLTAKYREKTCEKVRIYSMPRDLMSSNLHLYLVVIAVVIVVVVVLVVMMVMMTGMCLFELLRHQSQYLRKDHCL